MTAMFNAESRRIYFRDFQQNIASNWYNSFRGDARKYEMLI